MADEKPVTPRQKFYNALFEKFRELRPQYTGTTPDPTNPVFQRLFIIDHTLTNPDLFDAGLAMWIDDNDVDKFLDEQCAAAFTTDSNDLSTPTQ